MISLASRTISDFSITTMVRDHHGFADTVQKRKRRGTLSEHAAKKRGSKQTVKTSKKA